MQYNDIYQNLKLYRDTCLYCFAQNPVRKDTPEFKMCSTSVIDTYSVQLQQAGVWLGQG